MKNLNLALSGGGDKGAFTVGVIKRMIDEGHTIGKRSMLAGTSTGALIVPLLASGDLDTLIEVYNNVSFRDVLEHGYTAFNMINHSAVYLVDPLEKLIEKYITQDVFKRIKDSGIEIFISTVCLQSKALTYFTNADVSSCTKYDIRKFKRLADLQTAILASCVQPVLMPPVRLAGEKFIDGGIKEYIPIDVLIDNEAEEITAIVTTTGERYYDNSELGFAKVALKTIEIFSDDVSQNDLRIAKMYNAGINFIDDVKERLGRISGLSKEQIENLFISRHNPFYGKRIVELSIIRPLTDLGDGLTFDTELMRDMYQQGLNGNFTKELNGKEETK